MRKIALLLLIASINLQAVTPPTKARARLKIGYGISALLAGAASPIMGGVHLFLGRLLSKTGDLVGTANDMFEDFFPRLAQKTSRFRGPTEKIMKWRATIQNTSGCFHLANTFFLIPLGVAAIKSGREELRELARGGQNGEIQIVGDKAKKS